ncbi:ComEA family DNA-binding protein [Flagellimonas myxillae]|uniref:ComEA family DNA-binding protein n=1 Tax=Flagellimonas myxillae TaxID=2942214 RepID=UPI00201FB124|nr:helix-hairpin-helix domain-containing protein [Muricauda myxillae]MCL6267982.1 helix-hairpin-helix domain-containing protein [Muricauda myxillae]
MKKFNSHFRFTKQERSGIFFLLGLIVLLQGAYYLLKVYPNDDPPNIKVDYLAEATLDSLKSQMPEETVKLYPFNPNFISDYKGYTLGISVEELDRLFAFRQQGKFVNSASQFQEVTKISDSLLEKISPYFKFPAWKNRNWDSKGRKPSPNKKFEVRDLNTATAAELKSIRGIGDKLSARIIKFRDRLGGFLIDGQLYDVYGLDPGVVERTLTQYKVLSPPQVKKINVNRATADSLARLVYINWDLAQEIVAHREVHGQFGTWDELTMVKGFPKERIDRIKLYLRLKN